MTTPTPRTNKIEKEDGQDHFYAGCPENIQQMVWGQYQALLKFARQLETELTAANKRAEELLTERDDAEQALSQAYFLIMGRSAEWSNCFGNEQALQDIDDAQRAFRAHIKKAQDEAEEAKEREARLVVKSLNIASRETARAEDALAVARELADLSAHAKLDAFTPCPSEWCETTGKWINCECGLSDLLQRLEALEKEGR